MRFRLSRSIESMAAHLVLLLFAFTALFPLSLVAINSLKTHPEVVRNPLALPKSPDWDNYSEAWEFDISNEASSTASSLRHRDPDGAGGVIAGGLRAGGQEDRCGR